jgi:glutamate racemase
MHERQSTARPAERASGPAPIGVYDSGVGGLSVLRALRLRLPGERFVYVADSGHAPYGDREPAFLEDRAGHIARFMRRCEAKALVLACNTVSVVAARTLRSLHAFPIVAMEPAIKPAAASTRSGVVLVLATATTIASPAVQRLCRLHASQVRMLLQACPGLVELVERGDLAGPATRRLLEGYLRPGLDAGADTIVLGCTHYPFLAPQIAQIAGPGVTLVEPSEAIAHQLARVLGLPGGPAAATGGAATAYYTSGPMTALREFLAITGEADPDVRPLPDPR